MKPFSKFGPGLLAPFIAVVCCIVLFWIEPLPLTLLRNGVFDQFQRWRPRPYQAAPVRIVDVDEESLKKLGQWPWPRTRMAELVDVLNRSGAAAIGLDIVFAEPDRTSPRAVSSLWPLPDAMHSRLAGLPDHDDVFAAALEGKAVVLGFAAGPKDPAYGPPTGLFRVVFSGPAPYPFLHAFDGAVTSLPLLERKAAGNGALTFVPDSDGVVRRIPLLIGLAGRVMPSFAAETLRVAQGERNYIVKTSLRKDAGVLEIRIGGVTVPTTSRGEMWIYYTPAVPARSLPAWRVFAGEVPREDLEGRIVLVGVSAQGLMDLRFSPLGNIIPGIEVHAQALEQIFTGTYLARPSWSHGIEGLLLAAGGLAVGTLALATPVLVSAGITAALLFAAGGGAWSAFIRHGLLLDPVTPGLVLLVAFILGSIVRHRTSEKRQRWVREAFSRYVSPNRVDYLVRHPDQLELGGKRRECSFVFTDLAGFTALIEQMDPAAAVSILNAYLDRMVRIAFDHGGTLDRIVGDSVAIMFSAPVIQPDHRARALACALDMHAFAESYAAEMAARGFAFGSTRIGVHTGEVIVGNFGGEAMFDYRALGDAVNTAARLESVNRHLGTRICVSEATLSGCPGAAARPVGLLVMKGKKTPLKVYEPITGKKQDAAAPACDLDYEEAFRLLQKQDLRAEEAFAKLASERPQDALAAFHLKRLQTGARGDTILFDEK
ncbi:MAG: adenylate/guanylate cyclase domain-containing protein [Deltaproteobacteria bacterium]